jgi:hypothetical protein
MGWMRGNAVSRLLAAPDSHTDGVWQICRSPPLAHIALERLPATLPRQNLWEQPPWLTMIMLSCRTAAVSRIPVARIRDASLLGSHTDTRIQIRGRPRRSIRGTTTQLPTALEYRAHRPSLCLKGPLVASPRHPTLAPMQESRHRQGTRSVAIPAGEGTIQALANRFEILGLVGLENLPEVTEMAERIQQPLVLILPRALHPPDQRRSSPFKR